MIEGEAGHAILYCVAKLREDGIVDGDQISVNLVASCLADSLRRGETPREIARGLLESLPSDEQWESGLRDRVIQAVDLIEEGGR